MSKIPSEGAIVRSTSGATTTLECQNIDVSSLCARHRKALLGRGLDINWIEVNCRSLSAHEASQRLGYLAKSGGILLEGHGLQTQFKPDKPWKNEGEKKAAKYRSPLGGYDAMLPVCPDDPAYWKDLEALKDRCYKIDGHPCLIVTEGLFKAIAGCSIGSPTIALLGIEMGLSPSKADVQGKRYLVPILEKYARVGFGFVVAFDADATSNKNVIWAQRKLAEQLLKFAVPVYSVTGLWSIDQGKGMDDYIQVNGGDSFKRNVLGKASAYSDWLKSLEKQFTEGQSSQEKTPSPDVLGAALAEKYSKTLAFNNESHCWMHYEADFPGVWSPETDEFIESLVYRIIKAKGIKGFSPSYLTAVTKIMRSELIVRKWVEASKDYLPFENGVLEIETKELLPHNPSYRFTWSLPRQHNQLASDWATIETWMDEATGHNEGLKAILLCWLNAVLKGRSDLQKFLYLTGPGGTGKGTMLRLCSALIGERNTLSTSLEDWNNNRFEPANGYRKRLIMFADEDKYKGSLGNFKKLTGGDWLRGEEKGKKAFQYKYDGMVMAASNFPVFGSDTSSGMARRLLTVPFSCTVPGAKVRDLDTLFVPELDALTNCVLALDDEYITQTLRQISAPSPEVIRQTWEYRMRTDSIAAWLNDCLIHDPDASEAIGNDRDDVEQLFGNYYQNATTTGGKPKGSREFRPSLLELCNVILGWNDVIYKRTASARLIQGLRLRRPGFDDHIPYPLEALSESPVTDRSMTDAGDGSEVLADNGYDGCDGSEQLFDESKQQLITEVLVDSLVREFHPIISDSESNPSHPSQSFQNKGFSNHSHPSLTDKFAVSGTTDYSSFPHLTCDTVEAKRNQAEKIKQLLLEADSREELTAIKQKYSTRCRWVWRHLLNEREQEKLRVIAQSQQLNLLSSSTNTWMTEENLETMANDLSGCSDREEKLVE